MDALSSINQRITEIQAKINPAPLQTTQAAAASGATLGASAGMSTTAPWGATNGLTATQFASPGSLSQAGGLGHTTGFPMSFEDLLTQATSATQGTSMQTAAAGINTDGVPIELLRYGNGRVPQSALAEVPGTNKKLWAPAAEQLGKMIADARKDGVTIGITDAYRGFDSQVNVAQSKGLYSEGGLAAKPGTSKHGWGMAADLRLNPTAQAWMREHASDYGYVENVPREPWHWEFQPHK